MLLAVVLGFFTLGCEDEDKLPTQHYDFEGIYAGNIDNETFMADPAGTSVDVLSGTVHLTFPPGAVLTPTEFTITATPLYEQEMNGKNIMNWKLSLESGTADHEFNKNVQISLKYNMDEFINGVPLNERNLTIYTLSQDNTTCSVVASIGNCNVDCSSQTVNGCICGCGDFVIGEK